MRGFLARLFITAFGLWLADVALSGVQLEGWLTLVLSALLLGLVNGFVRPLVILLTFPITLVTLGLFLFVINGAMVLFVAWFVPSFHIDGLGWGILVAMIVGLTGWAANAFIGSQGKVETWTVRSEK